MTPPPHLLDCDPGQHRKNDAWLYSSTSNSFHGCIRDIEEKMLTWPLRCRCWSPWTHTSSCAGSPGHKSAATHFLLSTMTFEYSRFVEQITDSPVTIHTSLCGTVKPNFLSGYLSVGTLLTGHLERRGASQVLGQGLSRRLRGSSSQYAPPAGH